MKKMKRDKIDEGKIAKASIVMSHFESHILLACLTVVRPCLNGSCLLMQMVDVGSTKNLLSLAVDSIFEERSSGKR